MDISKTLESIDEFTKQAMITISDTFDNLKITDSRLSETRMITCVACPHYISSSAKCSLCGCYIPIKTKIIAASCPADRW